MRFTALLSFLVSEDICLLPRRRWDDLHLRPSLMSWRLSILSVSQTPSTWYSLVRQWCYDVVSPGIFNSYLDDLMEHRLLSLHSSHHFRVKIHAPDMYPFGRSTACLVYSLSISSNLAGLSTNCLRSRDFFSGSMMEVEASRITM